MSGDVVAEWVKLCLDERARVVEAAVEAALQGGTCGVSVWARMDGGTFRVEADLDPLVPYGCIHEHEVP